MDDPAKIWQLRWAHYLARWVLYLEAIAFLVLPFALSYGCGANVPTTIANHVAYTFPCLAGVVWGLGFFAYRFRPDEELSDRAGRRFFMGSVHVLMVALVAYLFPLFGSRNGNIALAVLLAVWVSIILAVLLCIWVVSLGKRWRIAIPCSAAMLSLLMLLGAWTYFGTPAADARLKQVCHPWPE